MFVNLLCSSLEVISLVESIELHLIGLYYNIIKSDNIADHGISSSCTSASDQTNETWTTLIEHSQYGQLTLLNYVTLNNPKSEDYSLICMPRSL